MPLATSLASIDTTWTLSRSGTEKLTLSVNGGILVGQPTTHLTLSSLVMKCGTMAVDRTSALICVTNGKVSIEDCSVGDASGEIPIPFCTISTGTVESASLFALNGGSSTVNFASLPILGTGTGQNLFAVSGTSTLNLNEITLDGGDSSVESLLGQNGGTVTLEACSMSRMKMKKSFVSGSGTVLMKGCSFSSLVDDCSSGSGNVIEMGIGEGEKLEIMKTATDSCSFISCSSKGNGGALKIAVVSSGTVTISDTSFVCCSATGNGGGIWLDLSASTSTSTSFSSLVFGSGSDSNNAILGSKVFVQSSNVKTDAEGVLIGLKPTLSGSILTTAEKNEFVGNNTLPESLLFFWYPHIASSGAVHVHSDGEDHANCGRIELACQTLPHSFTSLKTTRTITLDSSLQVPASLPTLTQSLTISALAGSPQTLTLASDVSFTVSAGTLSFSSLSIELAELSTVVFVVAGGSIAMDSTCRLVNPSSATHSASLFSLSSGTLTLDTTTLDFSNRFISSQSLFSQSGGSLALSGMSIENVTQSSGDGSVISSTLSSGSLSIASCSFSSCVCSSGNGGVMKVVLTGTGTFTVTGTTTFSSCSASGDGNLIHLTRTDLVSFLKGSGTGPLDAIRPNTTSGVVFTSDVHEEFWGIDTNAVSPSSGSLLFYWYPHTTGSVRVASSGTDHPNCGLVELPCSSLSHSMNVMKTTKSVVMQSDMPLATSLASIDTTWTLSRSGTEKLTLSVNGGILVGQPTTHLTLSSLVMKCGTMAVDRTSALICVTNGKVSIEDCSVGDASGEIPIPFCTISTGTVESASLFALNGGSSTVNFASLPILGTGTGQNLFAVSGTSTLNLNEITLDGGDSSVESLLGQNGGTVTLEACSMSRMKMKKSFVSGSGTVLMKGCSFSSLVDDCSSGSGNVIEMGIGEGEKLEIMKTATDSCSFISCSSKGNGGALKIAVVSSGTVTISDTSFVCCSATGNGGGIWLDLSASTSTSTSFSSLVFGSGSDSNNAILGSKVFVQSSNVKTDAEGVLIGLKPTLSGSILTTAEKNEFVGNNTLPESLLFFWYPHIASSGAVHVHSDGEDHANCGRIELACQTLPHSFTSLKTTRTITLDSSLQVPASLPTLTQSLTISALAGSPQTLTLASDVSFTVSAGTLSFSSLSIELAELSTVVFVVAGGSIAMDSTCRLVNPSSATHSASLFSLSSGTLTLDTTTLDFSNRFISSQSLFSQSGGSLALSGMSIENVTQSSGDGSVISSTLSSGSLSIASCSFSSCVCSSGNGGVMKVVLTGTGTFTVTGTTTFSSCSASGDGNLIHLTRTDLVSFLKGSGTGPLDAIRPNTTSGVVFTSDVHEEFWGIDTNAVSPSSGSLLFYWYPHTTGSVRVASSGTDHPNCGLAELPCSSLAFGHDRLKETEKAVVLSSAASLGTPLKPAFAVETIKSLSSSQVITLSSNGQIKTDKANTLLTLSSLQFVLDTTTDRISSVFLVSGGTLVVSTCIIGTSTSTTPLTSSLMSVSAGSLEVKDNSVIQNMTSSNPILTLLGGTTTLVSATVRSIALTSSAAIVLDDGNLRLEDSSFSLITNTEGDGSVLSAVVKSGKEVVIISGSVSDCSTTGNGGALFLSLVGTGRLEMKGTNGMSFEKCSADVDSSKAVNTTGLGQCIFISTQATSTLLLGAITFPTVSATNPAPTDDLPLYSGHDGGIVSVVHPLITFLLDLSQSFVGSTGNDSLTLTRATERLTSESSSSMEIVVVDWSILNTSLNVGAYSLLVTSADKKIVKMDGGLFDMKTAATTTSSLTLRSLTLSWTGKGEQVLEHSKGTTTIAACSLVMTAESGELFSSHLFSVAGGSVMIEGLELLGGGSKIGTVLLMSGGTSTLDSLVAQNGKLTSSTITGSGSLVLKSSSLKNLDGSESTEVSGLRMSIASSMSVLIGGVGKNVNFEACSSKGSGGALNIALVSSGTLTISDTSFVSCSATGNGGGIWLDLSLSTATNPFTFSDLTFGTDATKNTASKGRNVYALAKAGSTSVLPLSAFVPSTPAQIVFDETERTMVEFGEMSSNVESEIGSLLYLLHPSGNDVRVRASVGFDHSLCGASVLPCSSLQKSYTNAQSRSDNSASVVLDSDLSFAETITSQNKGITITSASQNTLTFGASAQLNVVSDTLTLTSLKLGLPSSITTSPFVVSGGSLIIESSADISHSGTDSTPTLVSSPLFTITSGRFVLSGIQASPRIISNFRGSDACPSAVLLGGGNTAPTEIEISHCHFLKCHADGTAGKAGAVSLTGSRTGTIVMSDCYFAGNSGTVSSDVHATTDWSGIAQPGCLIDCFSDSDLDHVVIGTTSNNDLIPYSLLTVDNLGGDDANCHLPQYSCRSVTATLVHCDKMEKDGVRFALRLIQLLQDSSELSVASVANKRIDLSGSDANTKYIRAGTTSLLTLGTGTAKIHSLTLVDSNVGSTSPLFQLLGTGTLTIESVVHDGQLDYRAAPLVTTIAGSLVFNMVDVQNVNLTDSPLFVTEGTFTATDCQFATITRDDGNETILQATVDSTRLVTMLRCSFDSCLGLSEPRWISLTQASACTFDKSHWEGTFDLDSPKPAVLLTSATNLLASPYSPYSLLYEFYPRTDPKIFVSNTARSEDHPLCGNAELPCATIDEAIGLTSASQVEIAGVGTISKEMLMNGAEFSISGNRRKGTLQLKGLGKITNNGIDGDFLTLSHLTVDVSNTATDSASILTIETGSLEMKGCVLASSTELSSTLILMSGDMLNLTETDVKLKTSTGCVLKVTQGRVLIHTMSIESASFSTTPFVFSSSSKTEIESLTMSNTTTSELFSFTKGDVTFVSSRFTGITQPLTSNEETLCEWSTGLIKLTNTTCDLHTVSFIDLDDGAIIMENSTILIETSTFHDNTPNHQVFSSVHRNIRCVGESTVTVGSLHGGDGSESDSMWISTDETCKVMQKGLLSTTPFFVPQLDSNESSSAMEKEVYTLTLKGNRFIPCGLVLEVFEVIKTKTSSEEGAAQQFSLSADNTTDWIETGMKIKLARNLITLDEKNEFHARLATTNGYSTPTSILFKLTLADEKKARIQKLMTFLIPIICGVVAALLIAFFIILFCALRKKKQREGQKLSKQEINNTQDDDLIDMKIDDIVDTMPMCDSIVPSTRPGKEPTIVPTKQINSSDVELVEHDESMKTAPLNALAFGVVGLPEMVDAIGYTDDLSIKKVNKGDTLFKRLHSSSTSSAHLGLYDKKSIAQMLTKGLENLLDNMSTSDILIRLTPSRICFDELDQLYFKVVADAPQNQRFFESWGQSSLVQSDFDELRWVAPEIANKEHNPDVGKAAVFSLGLILWELETGLVPFPELDAQNAQRLLSTGTELNFTAIKDQQMVEKIKQCLSIDPTLRPTLHDMTSFCWGTPEDEGTVKPQPPNPIFG
ncbi:hypothetical protein BLNAU_10935 [Blattamonas nauphoetae]|uniref:Protein kinase domain-containing protein n=1 Tax=Blattamonas nauphoetae TaxID=2049346 RepID=A0ABQ9XNX2_9EUKA|nr:hypothetical protein BLNAU_10935 [Blattamonas nauphoetae]